MSLPLPLILFTFRSLLTRIHPGSFSPGPGSVSEKRTPRTSLFSNTYYGWQHPVPPKSSSSKNSTAAEATPPTTSATATVVAATTTTSVGNGITSSTNSYIWGFDAMRMVPRPSTTDNAISSINKNTKTRKYVHVPVDLRSDRSVWICVLEWQAATFIPDHFSVPRNSSATPPLTMDGAVPPPSTTNAAAGASQGRPRNRRTRGRPRSDDPDATTRPTPTSTPAPLLYQHSSYSSFDASLPAGFWNDTDYFLAFGHGMLVYWHSILMAAHQCSGVDGTAWSDLQWALTRFSSRLRNDATLIRRILSVIPNNKSLRTAKNLNTSDKTLFFSATELFLKTCHVNAASGESNKNDISNLQTTSLLRNNLPFALFVVEAATPLPANVLKLFSKRLQDNVELVTAALSKNGLCLQYAPYLLRRQLCAIACQSHAHALVYSLPLVNNKRKHGNGVFCRCEPFRVRACFLALRESRRESWMVASDVSLLKDTATLTLPSAFLYRRFYFSLPRSLHQDHEIALSALLTGCIAVPQLPDLVRTSVDFWKLAIATHPGAWLQLPTEALQEDISLAWALPHVQCRYVMDRLFEIFPQLIFDVQFWLTKIISSPSLNNDTLFDVLLEGPDVLWQSKEAVLAAVSRCVELLDFAHMALPPALQRDRDVFEAAVECSWEALMLIDSDVLGMYPDLVARAIRSCDIDDIWDVYEVIEDSLWLNRDVVYAWLSIGGDYLRDEFLLDVENDPEAFLLIAQNNEDDFWRASDDLLANKGFLLGC